MAKMLAIDPKKCTSCRLCEQACSFITKGEFNPARSRIQVAIFPEEGIWIPMSCTQCDDPMCTMVCPSGALKPKDPETGLVALDENICVGCKMCTMACPFGAVVYDAQKGVADKCDLCNGDPECVKFCVYGALEFKEEDIGVKAKRRALAEILKDSYKEVRV